MFGVFALSRRCLQGEAEEVAALLDEGAKPEARLPPNSGSPFRRGLFTQLPLQRNWRSCDEAAQKDELAEGLWGMAQVRASSGATPLMLAAAGGHRTTVEALLPRVRYPIQSDLVFAAWHAHRSLTRTVQRDANRRARRAVS